MNKKSASAQTEFFTKNQIAEMFSVSGRTVERWLNSGLRSAKIGRKRYITREQINDYVARHIQSA